jgi:ADP-ribose pyrophosphatase YjhB (NUDIX family)
MKTYLFSIASRAWKAMPPRTRRWLTRRLQTSFTASAACVIVNDRGQVLLLDHVLRPHSGWGLAGGFLESGEQPEDAVRREVCEETGLELKNVRLLGIRTTRRHLEIAYIAEGGGEAVVSSREITGLQWFAPDELPADIDPHLGRFIRSAIEGELEP